MKQLLANATNSFSDWLDSRTGYRKALHESLYENIPGGSRWIYVTGSMLVCAFMTQVVTGIFLWMVYSPGTQNAWESVYYLQNEMQGGWLLRGMHHFMAQAMVVLLPLHLAQVVLCRAYLPPREINYWLGLVLMLIVLGLGLTGYLLPWDQKGYWATKVATELMSLPPGGAIMQKLVVGGREYGHATLTRFFALHAGVLPALLVAVLFLHVALFRKHGITAKSSAKWADEYFWPMQVYKDAVACGVLLALVTGYTIYQHGAELGPPAEPTESYGAARPEWYFLFLFQMLKYFEENEFLGAIVVPTVVMAFLFAMPLIARVRYLHWINVLVIITLMVGVSYLTYEAIDHDNYHTRHKQPPADTKKVALHKVRTEASISYHEAREQAEHEYERMRQLVEHYGIPREGAAVSLVRNDPELQGPRIFRRKCANCHSYLDANGKGIRGPARPEVEGKPNPKAPPFGAPNLYGFATREWFQKVLNPEHFVSDDLFGTTKHKEGEMATFVMTELGTLSAEQKQQRDLIVAALSAEAALAGQRQLDAKTAENGELEKGRAAITTAIKDQACTDCHKFGLAGELGMAPDLTGYGSREWLRGFLSDPSHERFYGEKNNDRMPSFAPLPGNATENELNEHDLDLLVRWLRGDDRELRVEAPKAVNAKAAAPAAPTGKR